MSNIHEGVAAYVPSVPEGHDPERKAFFYSFANEGAVLREIIQKLPETKLLVNLPGHGQMNMTVNKTGEYGAGRILVNGETQTFQFRKICPFHRRN